MTEGAQMQPSDASPVIFLPGLLCDGLVWTSQLDALGDHAICSVAEYGTLDSLPAMAEAVLEWAPAQFAIVGHSMGGRVALEIYRRASERIRGLALFDTGYQALERGDAGERERAGRLGLVELARRSGTRAMGMQWVRGMVHPDRLDDAAVVGAILDKIERKAVAVFEAQQRALLARPDARDLLGEIRCPTLILCGRQDAWSPLSRHEEMQRLVPDSKLVVVEECGHMSTMERPVEVNGALQTWLTSTIDRRA